VLRLVAILRFIRRSTVLVGVGLAGGTVTAAGVVMLVTPGPGLLVIVTGLAILATQFAWAERALERMKARARSARDKASARRYDRRAARTEAGLPPVADLPPAEPPAHAAGAAAAGAAAAGAAGRDAAGAAEGGAAGRGAAAGAAAAAAGRDAAGREVAGAERDSQATG